MLQPMSRQSTDAEFSDNENDQEMLAEKGNDFVGVHYASSDKDFGKSSIQRGMDTTAMTQNIYHDII